MGPNGRQHRGWAVGGTVTARVRCLYEGVQGDQKRTVGDLTAALAPPPLNRVPPRAVGGQIQEDYPSRGRSDHRVDLRPGMWSRVIPGDRDGAGRMSVDESLPSCGALASPLGAAAPHDGLRRSGR
jgi:hypothetical protein